MAGNALDGNFYGPFPTGDGLAGGNFVAAIYTFHNVVLPFVPIADGYVPPPKGIDPPAGASHLGKAHKLTTAHKTKLSSNTPVTEKIAVRHAKLKAFDVAIRELAHK